MRNYVVAALLAGGILGWHMNIKAGQDDNADNEKLIAMREQDPEQFRATIKERMTKLRTEDPERFEQIKAKLSTLRQRQQQFIMKHGDTNNDGKIDDAERKALNTKREELVSRWQEDSRKEGQWSDVADIADDLRGKPKETYDEIYDHERFDNADTNHDGILNKDELKTAQKDFEYYSAAVEACRLQPTIPGSNSLPLKLPEYKDNARFQHADANNDGTISLAEAKTEKQWEKEHHLKLEKQAVEDFKTKYPDFNPADAGWFKNHPEALNTMTNHPYWVKANYEVLNNVRQDTKWLAEHPTVANDLTPHWRRFDRAEDFRDRREDVRDRREDVRDAKYDGGKADKIEDKVDRREDRRDRREDVRDKTEDKYDALPPGPAKDKIEDRADRREDVRDKRENRHDRHEDVWDKKEDVRDAKYDGGKADKIEDKIDKREDVRDRREDKFDRRENVRDRHEDVWDAKHNWNDNFFRPKVKTAVPRRK